MYGIHPSFCHVSSWNRIWKFPRSSKRKYTSKAKFSLFLPLWGTVLVRSCERSAGIPNISIVTNGSITCTKIAHIQSLPQSATKLPRHVLKWSPLENKTILTPPLHSTLGCLLFSTGRSNSGTTLHGGGEDEKINIFSFLSWQNVREALKGKVSQLILLLIVAYKAGVLKVKSGAWEREV